MTRQESALVESPRLSVHRLTLDDAGFVLRLLNEPGFLRFIGDKGVRNDDDARRYLQDGPLADYQHHGYGACLVRQRDTGEPMGICGFYQREGLDCPDLGFAFSGDYWGYGYAVESSTAILDYGRRTLGLDQVAAIVDAANERSIRVIEKLGFKAGGYFRLPDEEEALRLYRLNLVSAA